MFTEITKCRASQSSNLIPVLSLGEQFLTGVFPSQKEDPITKGPLDLVWCPDSDLLQLKQSYSLSEMYGDNYGYRSGLNISMVQHLQNKIKHLEKLVPLSSGDLVIDIGSNDATALQAYKNKGILRVGIDPVGKKFEKYYTNGIELIPEFFQSSIFQRKFTGKKAKIVTSIAMFYDIEDPKEFVTTIEETLDDNGIWHFEQSYMPAMLRTNAYDTICHEHLEYYSLGTVKKILDDCGLKILDVQFNDVNGGSFAVTAAKRRSNFKANETIIDWLLLQEDRMDLNTPRPYRQFEERVFEHRINLISLIKSLTADGKRIFGYGASTKGNVLLQFCGFTEKDIPYIAEVNQDKFGCYTPGTLIPIISEQEARKMNPDYFMILPWHFKNVILAKEQNFISRGGKFIIPLPEIQIV